ncbi:axonemal dynein light intermediate polypeptide 1 [Gallus gallus]|uniref:Axonemal dynein light intermediate polypeptide 1 n=1 Tax=Gallus gallus TaxID=9031 RepID=A0A8V0Z3P5_CHICK|nr:axonemal dynein light intermediate polypeptide 1 [Gallus gallus]XP_417762.3 axonemal dynein light intermediate polypeptide 1 [Gallus gallus]|eukprot:XP_417762.3 axonemal dynein light intermediate polypeptide 1 [Gallus gallus]
MATIMIPPPDSLLRYNPPMLVSRRTEKRSPEALPLKGTPQPSPPPGPVPPSRPRTTAAASAKEPQEILNAILPPRSWEEDNRLWVQEVSSVPSTRLDVVQLQEQLDLKLQQRQARETGICPVRRELYSQCFDELIRETTINCAERGLLLLRVRDEIQMTIAAYQTLYESSIAFGMRKALQAEQGKSDMEKRIEELEEEKRELERLVSEEKAKCEAIEKREIERRQIEEKKHAEEVQFLKRTNQQLKAQLESIIAPNK